MGEEYKLYTDSSIDSVHRVLLSRGFEPNYVLATHAYIGRGGILLDLSQPNANPQDSYHPQTNNEQLDGPRVILSGSLEKITAFHGREFNPKEQKTIGTNISLVLLSIQRALEGKNSQAHLTSYDSEEGFRTLKEIEPIEEP